MASGYIIYDSDGYLLHQDWSGDGVHLADSAAKDAIRDGWTLDRSEVVGDFVVEVFSQASVKPTPVPLTRKTDVQREEAKAGEDPKDPKDPKK